MKFGQTLMCCMKNISKMFWLNAGYWELVPGPFMNLLKWQYEIQPFLIVEIYHFQMSFIQLFKKMIGIWIKLVIG